MQRTAGVLLFLCGASAVVLADVAVVPQPELAQRRAPPPKVVKPPPTNTVEVADHAKALIGTWQCKGTLSRGDGSSQARHATMTVKLDLDGGWIAMAMVENTESTGKRTAYRTYDPVAKQWTQVTMGSGGVHSTTASPGEAQGAWMFAGVEEQLTASIQVRDHEERTKDGLKLWRESLLGGAWTKTSEMTCVKDAK